MSHHDVGAEVIRNARKLPDKALCDYTDGSAFKNHPLFSIDPMAIRLHFYVDDFEVCNPIGSRRTIHKLTAVYFVVGNVSPKYWSQSSTIHLALLARTQLVKNYGLEKVLEPLITDLQLLESDGICVKLCNTECHVHGSLATISADNLGSHQVGGFRQTFSSGKMCRFCMVDFHNLSQHVTEEHCVIRTPDGHANHLNGISVDPSLSSTYGVKSVSPFNKLTHFSVTESLPPHSMHDILEGLCPINVCFVLQCLIQLGKLKVKRFNEKLDLFAFSANDMATKPPHIPDDIVSRGKLAGSASQNWCLFRNLPFLVGDIVDCDADYRVLHLLCRDICRIIFAPVIMPEWLIDLQQYIAEHHTLLAHVNSSLFTPKLHFLTHYPRLISLFGPLKHLWCMRFESCHQYFKKIARISSTVYTRI